MTDLLLDTHALIWWWLDDPKLSDRARAAIASGKNCILVSAVSIYEIASKNRSGRLPAMRELLLDVDASLAASSFVLLPLTARHAARAGFLSGAHRDPFDRIIAAQGLVEDVPVVTCDREIAAFGCETLW